MLLNNFAGTLMKRLFKAVLPALLLVLSASSGFAVDVVLPLTLDHKLLTSLLLHDSFSGDEQSAAIFGTPGDCTYVRLSEPQFSSAEKLLRLDVKLDIRVGTKLGATCFTPLEWHGYLELLQQPIFDGRTFTLSFHTVDSRLLTLSRKPATIAGFLWRFAKPKVYEHLDKVHLDLAPPITDLRSFLTPLFSARAQRATQAMLDSLHGGRIDVGKEAVVVELLAEVEEIFQPEADIPVPELTVEERDQLVRLWETWDAFLVRLLVTMATQPLRPEDRQTLIEVLLDTRYVFIAALDQKNLGKDFVRLQFLQAWRQLAPVYRRQLYSQPSDNSIGYLAFFTAADALAVFDRMGPTLGIEISQQGLLRLAEMMAGKSTTLPYGPQLDNQLRELLQLPPIEPDGPPPGNMEDIDIQEEEPEDDPFSQVFDFFFKPAYGAAYNAIYNDISNDSFNGIHSAVSGAVLPTYAEIFRWRPPGANVAEYVARVKAVLAEGSDAVLARGEIPQHFHAMFEKLIPAMAWQESCFRQFVVKNKKLTYLLSYNQTSVGIMQINELVWRGVYDRNRLRWDIRYNALAGSEIADLYLRTYALKDSVWDKNGDMDLLSRVVYAMYNGGPGQYKKFLARERAGKHYLSDRLFLEKMQWVGKGQWENVDACLIVE